MRLLIWLLTMLFGGCSPTKRKTTKRKTKRKR